MMRPIILFLLACAPIWAAGNTCTLADGGSGAACHSGTCTLSAIAADTGHANWSGSGCTAAGYVPSSDYIVIPDGYNLTADQPWIVGSYGAPLIGYVYGVTGLPTSGYSGTCTATFNGGDTIMGNGANANCAINGAGAVVLTIWALGLYTTATPPTVTFTGNYTGSGTVQFIAGGGVPAVNLNNTGVLQISAAVTARGSIIYTHGQTNTTDAVIGLPGGSLIWDSSGAADPTDTRYQFTGNAFYYDYRAFHAMGTASQHFTVTSQVGGGNGFFGQISSYCCPFLASYTDFSRIGDSLFTPILVDPNVVYDVEHSTFTGMVPISIPTSATSVVRHDYNVHSAPVGATDISIIGTAAVTSGVREAVGNVFAAPFSNNLGLSGGTFTGNYFGASVAENPGYTEPWAAFSGNFVRILGEVMSMGDVTDSYIYWDYDEYNPHWIDGWASASHTTQIYSGDVIDLGGDSGGGDGNTVLTSGETGYNFNATNTITTPDAGLLSSSSSLLDILTGASSGSLSMNHNTVIVSDGVGGQGAAQTETVEGVAGQFASVKSNIVWSSASLVAGYNPEPTYATITAPGFKFYDSMGTQTDVMSPANGDYNVGWRTINTGDNGTGFAHSGNSYIGKFSATPGTHDLSVNPWFADATRNLMTFDYYYLGHHYSDWQTSHAYSVGDTVTHVPTDGSGPIFFGGASINYRCIVAHTSDTAKEPGAARYHMNSSQQWVPSSTRGSTWRTYWEPASLYQLRQGVAAQTKITDGAIGCVACGIIDALRKWVFTGYTPSNPALWCAGHDGETIGAVPFCGKGKAVVAALGGL